VRGQRALALALTRALTLKRRGAARTALPDNESLRAAAGIDRAAHS